MTTSVDHILHVNGDRSPQDSKTVQESADSAPVVPLTQKVYIFIFA